MSNFVVLARKQWGDVCVPLTQVSGCEGRAINIAQDIYKNGGMNRAIVVDERFKIVFKIDRRCRCTNQQYQISGELRCMECNRIVPTNGEFKVKEYMQ